MQMMQGMTQLCASLSLLGSTADNNYILTGCDEQGGIIGDGVVVIGGTPYKFVGGALKATVSIIEEKQTLTAFGRDYPEARTKRTVSFVDGGGLLWSGFKRIPTLWGLQTLIESIKGDTPGTIKMWAGEISKVPVDWKLCNGDELLISEYPELYDNLGFSFAVGPTAFRLPDLRGRFIVGYDNSRTAYEGIGKVGGEESHALAIKEMPVHDHTTGGAFNKLSAKASDVDEQSSPTGWDADSAQYEYNIGRMNEERWGMATIQSVGGGQPHENRPPYYTLAYIIKVKP